MNILKSLIIWICFIPAAILNGGLREYILAPAIGQKCALPASGIILSGLIFLITWLMYPRLIKNSTRKGKWLTGIVWMLLTVIFEFATGLSGGNSISELLAAYNPLTGNLWLLVLQPFFLRLWRRQIQHFKFRKNRLLCQIIIIHAIADNDGFYSGFRIFFLVHFCQILIKPEPERMRYRLVSL